MTASTFHLAATSTTAAMARATLKPAIAPPMRTLFDRPAEHDRAPEPPRRGNGIPARPVALRA